jgi:hypothetical protein
MPPDTVFFVTKKDSEEGFAESKTRRGFVSASGAGAVSVFGLGRLGQVTRTKRVPKYYKDGEVVRWMEVPRKWYRKKERAREVLNRFNRDHLGGVHEGIMTSGLGRSGRTFGGQNGLEIVVTHDRDAPRPNLPNEVSGVPVRMEEEDGNYELQYCNSGNFDKYRGGLNAIDILTRDMGGTAGFRVTDHDGDEFMISAAHVFGNCTVEDPDSVYQQSEQLGEVFGGDVKADFVAFDDSAGNGEIRPSIREPDGTVKNLSAGASKDEIDKRASDLFDSHRKVGVRTGKTTGGIKNSGVTWDKDECITLKGEGIRAGTNGAEGDSGGPYYTVEDIGACVLGHHSIGLGGDTSITACGGSFTGTKDSLGLAYYWFEKNTTYRI